MIEYFDLNGVSILSNGESYEEGMEGSGKVVNQQLADILMNNPVSKENGGKAKECLGENRNAKDNIDDSSIVEQINNLGDFNLNGESDED